MISAAIEIMTYAMFRGNKSVVDLAIWYASVRITEYCGFSRRYSILPPLKKREGLFSRLEEYISINVPNEESCQTHTDF